MGRTTIQPTASHKLEIAEGFIDLLSYYIAEAFEQHDISTMSEGAQEIYDDCTRNRDGVWTGGSDIGFEEYVNSEQEKSEILGILEETKTSLGTLGKKIPVSELNRIEDIKDKEMRRYWTVPVRPQSLIALIEVIEQMIKGEWKGSDYYDVWFNGFPYPKGVKPI